MKKKTSTQSAFFNPRALFGFALCLLGVALAFFAINGLIGSSLQAQGVAQTASTPDAINLSAPAPNDMRPISAVRSLPLRAIPPINPEMAPGHDHAEPVQPQPPPWELDRTPHGRQKRGASNLRRAQPE